MARIGKISSYKPAWQNFDPAKTKLTKNQKEAAKRKELQELCRNAVKEGKLKLAFYQVNRSYLSDMAGKNIPNPPVIKSISRFV